MGLIPDTTLAELDAQLEAANQEIDRLRVLADLDADRIKKIEARALDYYSRASAAEAKAKAELLLAEDHGTPIEAKDIRQFQRIESRSTGAFGHIEVIRRGVVTRINEYRAGHFVFWSAGDFLGGDSYPGKHGYRYFLLEDVPENPYPREEA